MFLNFLDRNQNITLVNSLPLCEGLITQQRITDILNEKSVIDVFLVCNQTLPFLLKMCVDENRDNPLTNFFGSNSNRHICESDHNGVELYLNIKTPIIKPKREVLFNFKSKEGQIKFHQISDNSSVLKNCFKTTDDFSSKVYNFEKYVSSVL